MILQGENHMSANAASTPDLGALPEWNLSDLYPSRDSAELKRDLAALEQDTKAFRATYNGKLSSLSGPKLAEAIATYEALGETMGRIGSYASLLRSANMADGEVARFAQGIGETLTTLSQNTTFFEIELNEIDDTELERKRKGGALAKWEPFIRDARAYRPHQLSDEMTRFGSEMALSGRNAWTRFFDESIVRLRFPLIEPGSETVQQLTITEASDWLSSTNREKRRIAGAGIGKVLGENIHTFAYITNTLAMDKAVWDRWQRFSRVESARNLSNFVEDEVVDALASAVVSSFPRLSHRYYALKAKWFGGTTLDYFDRNAPLPDQDDRIIPWQQAQDTVLQAYGRFSPELAQVGQRFFDNAWIDAPVRAGKSPGAFAHPTVPSVHPYLLVNYQGRVRDVMTLAHELGHGVHQVLAGAQGDLQARTPLTLAETASVFGEMLTFQSLLAQQDDARKRRAMIAGKVEDMINTVVRQVAFYLFEQKVHNARRHGELSVEQIGDFWMQVQTESLGPALKFDETYRHYWSYIPHFIHSPFYVYAYAFGDCLVNSLYAVYQDAEAGFAQKYLDLLRAGGSKRHKELLAPFGLDASDPAFWQRGMAVIEGLIDQLEE
jgi:oligoendopeptidase F